ncbi:cytochrome P450 77A2-like [Magnolia sinica]|uniref:cytochrome P450 77A2-like n=1 Tax=Magnolia sinica TaxID=86752 RepID=UPI0026592045|nr:cytochrome P450 77A2-like [Magnolia sinica]
MASFSPSDYNAIFMFMALLSALIFFFKRKSKNSSLNLPPGPPGWPIVGNLIQFIRSGKPFMHFSRDLRSIYGPIFTIKMGARTHIVISSAELAHEALVARGQTFASRPPETLTRAVYSCDKFTVNSAVYGPVWRSLRRNMVSNMLSASRLREFRDVRQRAMDRLIDRLRAESESTQCGAVHVLKNARFAVFCILLSMCFGVEMEESDIVNIDCLMKKVLIVLNPRLDDFLPFLSSLFTKQRKEAMQVREEQMRTLVPLIDRRRSDLNDPSPDKKCASFAYLDTLFDLQVEGRKSSPTDAEIVTLCSEFLNGGTDTTATAIEWAIARMIHDPDIQSKLYQEIVAVAGNRKVDEKDIDKMVYLNAFIKELLRKHPPTHLSLTHAVVEPTTLGGYDIPPGVNVEFYLLPISEDPTCWSDPESFDPDRFASGKESADITGVTGIKMMPFGVGRRICPGLSMAMLHISLMVARLVQEFEWCALPSQRTIDFSEKLEFTVVMKTSLQAVIKPRK